MIGEIGGSAEEDAAEFLRQNKVKKPMCGFIAGVTALRVAAWAMPAQSSRAGRRDFKDGSHESAGIMVADSPASLGTTVVSAMKG